MCCDVDILPDTITITEVLITLLSVKVVVSLLEEGDLCVLLLCEEDVVSVVDFGAVRNLLLVDVALYPSGPCLLCRRPLIFCP